MAVLRMFVLTLFLLVYSKYIVTFANMCAFLFRIGSHPVQILRLYRIGVCDVHLLSLYGTHMALPLRSREI